MNTIDGTPDAMKVACPVLAGGKAGDYFKGLPIGTLGDEPAEGPCPVCGPGVPAGGEEHRAGLQAADHELREGAGQPLRPAPGHPPGKGALQYLQAGVRHGAQRRHHRAWHKAAGIPEQTDPADHQLR